MASGTHSLVNMNFGKFFQSVVPSLRRKKLASVNISVCNVCLKSIKCLRVAWSYYCCFGDRMQMF